jgi:predicted transcriptional regulator
MADVEWVQITARVPRELAEQLSRTADRRGVPISVVIRQALATETRHDGGIKRDNAAVGMQRLGRRKAKQ